MNVYFVLEEGKQSFYVKSLHPSREFAEKVAESSSKLNGTVHHVVLMQATFKNGERQ